MTRVMLCDDHEAVREGLRGLISRHGGMAVVAEAATARDAAEAAAREKPDVAVVDLRLPDGSGVEACRAIREVSPETKVIMLTSFADDDALFSSIIAGASGYLLKQGRGQPLLDAICDLMAGRPLLDPGISGKVIARLRRGSPEADPLLATLTEQERRVLALVAEGQTDRRIADALVLSEKTVRNYVSRILDKLGLSRRAQAGAHPARGATRH